MRLEYGDIFTARGDAYHGAMLRHPHARDAEFAQLFEGTPVHAGQRVLDMPSGGGYLRRWLPDDVEVLCLELTPGFGGDVPVYAAASPWTYGSFGHAVCLAALHHIEDQAGFLASLLTRLHPHGTLHLADVARGSGIARFLDGFVDRYTATGHEGRYLAVDPAWFARLGHVARIGERACPWVFDDEAQMLEFCAGLFGLLDCPPAALREALGDLVGFRCVDDHVVVDWRLLYVDIQRA